MQWTSEVPKVAGLYWWRAGPSYAPRGYNVGEWPAGGFAMQTGNPWPNEVVMVEHAGGQWAGPIPLPVEASDE